MSIKELQKLAEKKLSIFFKEDFQHQNDISLILDYDVISTQIFHVLHDNLKSGTPRFDYTPIKKHGQYLFPHNNNIHKITTPTQASTAFGAAVYAHYCLEHDADNIGMTYFPQKLPLLCEDIATKTNLYNNVRAINSMADTVRIYDALEETLNSTDKTKNFPRALAKKIIETQEDFNINIANDLIINPTPIKDEFLFNITLVNPLNAFDCLPEVLTRFDTEKRAILCSGLSLDFLEEMKFSNPSL